MPGMSNAGALDAQAEMLMHGCEFGDSQLEASMRERLRARLAEAADERRPLRVYTGYDPTAPDLHLGHSITLRAMRRFQQLGHHVIVVVGTVTAMVGDTSDRAAGRPRKSAPEVAEAARSYAEQAFTILDPARTEVAANGDWLAGIAMPQILEIASTFTVQQFLARDNYRRRIEHGDPVGLHEFLYALLQGYDAVHLRADVQLGATEQLFNIMAGAKLQEASGQPPCVALTFPVLVGTDGTDRMSKSRGNYIGLTAARTSSSARSILAVLLTASGPGTKGTAAPCRRSERPPALRCLPASPLCVPAAMGTLQATRSECAPLACSPGTSAVARSAASSIRSRRSISSPMYRTNDASSAVLPGRIRAQNATSLRASPRCLLTGARVITCGIPKHLSARSRPSGQPGPRGFSATLAGSPRSVAVI
jgi:hypothetical protein